MYNHLQVQAAKGRWIPAVELLLWLSFLFHHSHKRTRDQPCGGNPSRHTHNLVKKWSQVPGFLLHLMTQGFEWDVEVFPFVFPASGAGHKVQASRNAKGLQEEKTPIAAWMKNLECYPVQLSTFLHEI